MLPPFRNEILTDFGVPENGRRMEEALARTSKDFGKEYPLVIGGKKVTTRDKLGSFNPSRRELQLSA